MAEATMVFTPEITGQDTSSTLTYAYLFEPLITKGSAIGNGTYFYLGLTEYNPEDNSGGNVIPEYAKFDLDGDGEVKFDLIAILRQAAMSNIYKISQLSDIDWQTIVTPYYYRLRGQDEVEIYCFPILGGRPFNEFIPTIDETQAMNEWEAAGLTLPQFKGFPYIEVQLADLTATDKRPTVTRTTPTTGEDACGGFLLWKSKYGGWCGYGFDMVSVEDSNQYQNDLDLPEFDAINGSAFMPTNYTGIATSRTISLKTIGIGFDDANAMRGIRYSPAVYYMAVEDSQMELMRVTSASIPLTNKAGGATVEIQLSSINRLTQLVR